ncbi:MAG: HAMP domain-containing protein [Deltaproteobacteria bacterium]|nr:HAMP domain-containing protein [Deltaproteobacteria bacterium]
MTFRVKLLLAQAPLGIVLVLVCVLSLAAISTLGSHSQTILKDNYRSVLAVQRMKEAAERLEDNAVLGLLKIRRHETWQPSTTYLQQFEQELQAQEGNITELGERELTMQLRALWSDYRQKLAQLNGLDDASAAHQFYSTELETTFHNLRAVAETLLTVNQDSMVRKSEAVRHTAARLNGIVIVGAVGALLLGLFFANLLTNRLLRPLSMLSQVTRRIGEGDFQARVDISGQDEIAQLAKEFNSMASSLAEYRNSSLGELLHAQEALQAAIDSLPDPVVVFGIAGDTRNVNRAAETVLGLHLDNMARDPLLDADSSIRTVLERLRTHVLSGRGAFTPKGFEDAICLSSREGDKYLLPRATPVYEMGGALVGATVLLQEVTRLRRFDELKNDLVATVAHEFRTPLTSLRMAIHLCLEQVVGPVTEKQADLLHAAREDCERLQIMVDDLLDLSRIESGRIKLQPRPTSLAELAHSVIAEHRSLAEEHGVQVSMVAPMVEHNVFADPERIALVLTNLLGNAIRHTPAGGQVAIHTRLVNRQVRCEVVDTGEGIPVEYRERIFDKFFRAPASSSGGAGLGLSIAKEIVQGHEGEIGVESEVGRGSTFWFTLPLAPALKHEDDLQV